MIEQIKQTHRGQFNVEETGDRPKVAQVYFVPVAIVRESHRLHRIHSRGRPKSW